MERFPANEKTKITRLAKRGVYEKDFVYSIIDEALFVTLAFVKDNTAFQIPTGHCRIGDHLYIHGSVGSGYMRHLVETNADVSISATLIDGLVLARSAFHHSMNYRSVVLFSRAEKVIDKNEIYLGWKPSRIKFNPADGSMCGSPTMENGKLRWS